VLHGRPRTPGPSGRGRRHVSTASALVGGAGILSLLETPGLRSTPSIRSPRWHCFEITATMMGANCILEWERIRRMNPLRPHRDGVPLRFIRYADCRKVHPPSAVVSVTLTVSGVTLTATDPEDDHLFRSCMSVNPDCSRAAVVFRNSTATGSRPVLFAFITNDEADSIPAQTLAGTGKQVQTGPFVRITGSDRYPSG